MDGIRNENLVKLKEALLMGRWRGWKVVKSWLKLNLFLKRINKDTYNSALLFLRTTKMIDYIPMISSINMLDAFEVYDKNKDGVIDVCDLSIVLSSLGQDVSPVRV